MPTPIDTLYQQQRDLLDYLREQKELSHHATASVLFQKSLLLAVASYFEHSVSDLVVRFLSHFGSGNETIISFAKKKGIDRQYHTYFQWEGTNANSFFALFGPTFSSRCKEEVKRSQDLNNAIRAFLELGNARNELVHLNFVTFAIEKTADEIYALYKKAAPFIPWLEQALGLEAKHETEELKPTEVVPMGASATPPLEPVRPRVQVKPVELAPTAPPATLLLEPALAEGVLFPLPVAAGDGAPGLMSREEPSREKSEVPSAAGDAATPKGDVDR